MTADTTRSARARQLGVLRHHADAVFGGMVSSARRAWPSLTSQALTAMPCARGLRPGCAHLAVADETDMPLTRVVHVEITDQSGL